MHEMSIARNILATVHQFIPDHSLSRVDSVFVEIGEIVAVIPQSLTFSWQAIVEDTSLQHSKLIIKITPAILWCHECQKEFQPEMISFLCPECGGSDVDEVSGREMIIKNITLSERETPEKETQLNTSRQ